MAAGFDTASSPHFEATLARHGTRALTRKAVATIQVNVGKLCNQACHHCHVDAGPKRIERMTRVGFMIRLDLRLADGQPLTVELTRDRVAELGVGEGDEVFVNLREAKIFVQDYSI